MVYIVIGKNPKGEKGNVVSHEKGRVSEAADVHGVCSQGCLLVSDKCATVLGRRVSP